MSDYRGVPLRNIYKALKKLEKKGKLDDFLAECEKKKEQAIVPVSAYERAVDQLAGGIMFPMSGTGTCPCIGPDD